MPVPPSLHDRRSFLRTAGLGALAVAAPACLRPSAAALVGTSDAPRWSDPAAWGGAVPAAGTSVGIDRPVLLDQSISVAGLRIAPGGVLTLDPAATIEIRTSGNLVVEGRLVSRPVPSVQHRVVFVGIDERRYVGGGMQVLASDVGLWVMGTGRLELVGAPKQAWSRAAGPVPRGAGEIVLRDDPVGWAVGDELVITPSAAPRTPGHAAYDTARVASIDGRTIRLTQPTANEHPAVDVGRGVVASAEVLNLTRNVVVEGTPTGRAHLFVQAAAPQELRSVAVRHVAPRKPAGRNTASVLGRYGVHFHMAQAGSVGSVVEGVVVTQAGGHAFVPHNSHGITFRDCISHDTYDEAYWWDGPNRAPAAPSHDLLWERCVASLVKTDPANAGYRLAGFVLGVGDRNVARGCVAVGVKGNRESSGFHWQENFEGLWGFEDCVSHNNACHGIFTWQNSHAVHVITGFLGYHNGISGIEHGAYRTAYRYERSTLYGNGQAGITLHSHSTDKAAQRFVDLLCDGAGISEYGLPMTKHRLAQERPTEVVRCQFRGHRRAAIGLVYEGGKSSPERLDVVHCTFEDLPITLANGINPGSRLRIQDARHGSLLVQRKDGPGTLRAEWNARITPIAPFSSAPATA